MIKNVFFDMGGTIEDIWYDDNTTLDGWNKAIDILKKGGIEVNYSVEEFGKILMDGITEYKAYSEPNMVELKPEQIWPDYYLKAFNFDRSKLIPICEDLAGMWEVTYFHRELRPHIHEMLSALKSKGYHISVISNTASLYSVFDVLEDYGIRDYMEDVTLSSVTGYRKPHPEIFKIALRQMKTNKAECCYVGDTISRDIIGAKQAGFGCTIKIESFLSSRKDDNVPKDVQPDIIVKDMLEIVDFVESRK